MCRCVDRSAMDSGDNLLFVINNKESTDLSASEVEVSTPLEHFDQRVSNQYEPENTQEGQFFSVRNEVIIPEVTVHEHKVDLRDPLEEENISTITINKEKVDLEELITKDNTPHVNKKSAHKRKPLKKKSLRKRFNRPKRRSEGQKRLLALKASSANPEINEGNTCIVPDAILSHFEHTDRDRDKFRHSDPFRRQEEEDQPLRTIVKEDPCSSIVNSISTNQFTVKKSQIRVKKIIFQRDTHRPGVIVGTPVNIQRNTPVTVFSSQPQPSSLKFPDIENPKVHPIHKIKSVFMKCFKKPVSTSSSKRSSVNNLQHPIAKIHAANPIFQQSISEEIISTPDLRSVSVKSDSADNYFMEDSLSLGDTTGQIPSLKDEQRGDLIEEIPTAAVTHITQPRNITIQPGLVVSQNALILTPMDQSENNPSSLSITTNGILNTGMLPQLDSLEVQQDNSQSIEQLLESVGKTLVDIIPPPWITVLKHNGIALCLLSHSNIITIQRSLLVEANGNVTVGVHGKVLPPENPFWQHVEPVELGPETVKKFIAHIELLLCKLRGMEVCKAVEDFEPFWNTAANCEIDLNRFHELRYKKCCRSQSCHLLVTGFQYKRCLECSKVWKLLSRRSLVDSKKSTKVLSLKKAFKYLTSPEKRERFDMAVKENRRLKVANKRLIEKLNAATSEAQEDSATHAEESTVGLPEEMEMAIETDSDFEWPETEDPMS